MSRLKTYIAAADPSSADGDSLGTASAEWSDLYLADGGVIYFGNDQDVTLTHVADTGLLLNSTMALQFNDASQYINAPTATVLDINATDEVEVNATLMDINANVEISGTATTTGVHTFTAVPVFPNNTVETADIQADAITGAKIADDAIDSEHYTDGSIDTAHIADNQITLAKMAGGTDGNVISYDASGDPVAIATGNDGQVLTSTGAGSPPAFEDAAAGGAMTLLSTTVADDSAQLEITGLDATKQYAVIIENLFPAAANQLRINFGTSAAYTTSGYDGQIAVVAHGSATETIVASGSSTPNLTNTSQTLSGNRPLNANLMLRLEPNSAAASGTTYQSPMIYGTIVYNDTATGNTNMGTTSVTIGNGLAAVDRFKILMASGNITSGRLTVWEITHA